MNIQKKMKLFLTRVETSSLKIMCYHNIEILHMTEMLPYKITFMKYL